MIRRKLMQSLGILPLVPITLSSNTLLAKNYINGKNQYLNPSNKKHISIIHRKLCFSFDDKPVFWFINARRYGLVNKNFFPFWNMHVGFISKTKNLDNNRFLVKTLSIIFYTNITSNKLLTTFKNPLTNKIHKINQPNPRISKRFYGKDGLEDSKEDKPGFKTTEYGNIGPAWAKGDDIWINADNGFRIEPLKDNGKLKQIKDWFTYQGSLKEVSNPEVKSANATQSFHDFNTWPNWLDLDSIQGVYVSRGFGKKVRAIEEMPDIWKNLTKDNYLSYYNNPISKIDL